MFFVRDTFVSLHIYKSSRCLLLTNTAARTPPKHAGRINVSPSLFGVVLVDVRVPEESLSLPVSAVTPSMPCSHGFEVCAFHDSGRAQKCSTYLVSITPEVVLGPDVLVGVFLLLIERRVV